MAIQRQVQLPDFRYRYTDALPHGSINQCVRCGVICGGPLDGLRPIGERGLVVLLQGPAIESCICNTCTENEEADYFSTR